MILKRFYHEGLAQASYMIGCQRTGEAVVIDANRDVHAYIDAASENGVRIAHVTETHIHADYLSGSRELAHVTGAQLLLSGEGGSDWQYAFASAAGARLLHDGDSFMVGNVRLDVMHTPGHTPEHLTFVVTDTPTSTRPVGAFTGDFIFVGDVGRPDLLERAAHIEGTMRASAVQLFASLQRFVSMYPDYLQLWPGHGSGSACGKSLGAVPQTTLGYERISNWALQLNDEGVFVDSVLEGQPDPPRYFATMKMLNRAGPALVGERPDIARLDTSAMSAALRDGVVLDVRRANDVAARGIRGALNIPFNKSFVGWAGWLVPYDRPLSVITSGENAELAREVAAELRMIGLDRVEGWFADEVVERWLAQGEATSVVRQLTPDELAVELTGAEKVTLVDVRAESEWEGGRIEGARQIALGHLEEQLTSIDRSRPVIVQCQGGGRSSIAASILLAHGFEDVRNVSGGIERWIASGRPVKQEEVGTGV